jgi:hypothetical protein
MSDDPVPDQPGPPSNERMRQPEPNVIDQRQQQIDPAGHERDDPDARPDANRKQPGGGIHDGHRSDQSSET